VTGVLPNNAQVTAGYTDYIFEPRTVVIARDGSVRWTFGTLEHTVTFAPASGAPQSILGSYNAQVDRVFSATGNFSYSCTIHAGMTGTVIVR
jgi:plastocyanin